MVSDEERESIDLIAKSKPRKGASDSDAIHPPGMSQKPQRRKLMLLKENFKVKTYDKSEPDGSDYSTSERRDSSLFFFPLTTHLHNPNVEPYGSSMATEENYPLSQPTRTYSPSLRPSSSTPSFQPSPIPSTEQSLNPEVFAMLYDNDAWGSLPVGIQESATFLGYTEEIWDADEHPKGFSLWSKLSSDQQEAAKTLGYNMDNWNNEVFAQATPNMYDEYYWDELPIEIQGAASILGYNKAGWDYDVTPEAAYRDWADLSEVEKKAAMKMGYDESS